MAGAVEQVMEEISAAVEAAGADVDEIERRLTDGYAHALSLEAERSRLEKQLVAAVRGLGGDRAPAKATTEELSSLAARLDGTVGDLGRLRSALAELRRHARALRSS